MEGAGEGTGGEEWAEGVVVVEEDGLEEGIGEGGAGTEEDAEAIGEARGAGVHLDEPLEGGLGADGLDGTGSGGEGAADPAGVMEFEGDEEVIGGRHCAMRPLRGAVRKRRRRGEPGGSRIR